MTISRLIKEDSVAAELVADVLIEAGIELVFGITGGHMGRLFAALEKRQDRIRTVLVREESLGSVMAEVYGRLRRRPGVLVAQGPWAIGNGTIGIIEALLSSSPMLILSDFTDLTQFTLHAPFQSGSGDYGSWDARSTFRGLTKQVFQALDPGPAVQATQLAIKHSLAGQPGPVAVLFGADALVGKISVESRPRIYPTSNYLKTAVHGAEAAAVQQAARALVSAKRPVLLAGNGVRIGAAYAELEQLAVMAGLPVATTAGGKGCFPETHGLALGSIGPFGTAIANATVGAADLVVVVGSKLGASDTARENPLLLDPERQTFIQIEVEPRNASWTYPVEHVLMGDAARVLKQLTDEVAGMQSGEDRLSAAKSRVAAQRREHGFFEGPGYDSPMTPIHPQRLVGELMRNLPDDVIVTCDAGENRLMMNTLYQVRRAGGFLQAAGAAPMGYAIPAALGAKLVHPDRPVVAVCGDGGFAMTMNGLMSARENDIPIVVVVFNNSALGWSLHSRSAFANKFDDFDLAAIARAMGCDGIRVTDPEALGAAIRQAVQSATTTVIDVVTTLEAITFADVTSPLMK